MLNVIQNSQNGSLYLNYNDWILEKPRFSVTLIPGSEGDEDPSRGSSFNY